MDARESHYRSVTTIPVCDCDQLELILYTQSFSLISKILTIHVIPVNTFLVSLWRFDTAILAASTA